MFAEFISVFTLVRAVSKREGTPEEAIELETVD